MLKKILFILFSSASALFVKAQGKQLFNANWQFVKDIDSTFSDELLKRNNHIKWKNISLPHTANIEPIEKVAQQWQGTCFYRKFFFIPASYKEKH